MPCSRRCSGATTPTCPSRVELSSTQQTPGDRAVPKPARRAKRANGAPPAVDAPRVANTGADADDWIAGKRPSSQSESTWAKDPVIELVGVRKSFGSVTVLDGVTVRIPRGESSV